MTRTGRDERGVAAIIISLSMVALLVITAMVLDFGIARNNRQLNKSVADAAVAAGIQGFDRGDSQVYAFKGVCDALGYLKTNAPELASLPAYAPCSNLPTLAKPCITSDSTTWAKYEKTTADQHYSVSIQAPYTLPDPDFSSDSYAGVATDVKDKCLQLAVIITEREDSAVGQLATKGKIESTIRTVGRVAEGPGTRSPALLILDRHRCVVLSTGTNSNSANANNYIRVFGNSSGGPFQPGTIHADSDGSQCRSNESIIYGKRLDGVVAYAATDGSGHGLVTSYAKRLGVADAVVSDGVSRVYGSEGRTDLEAATAPKHPVAGLGLITRKVVDDVYLKGVKDLADAAKGVFAVTTASAAVTNGYAVLNACTGDNQAAIDALDPSKPVFVDCASYRGSGTFKSARTVLFRGTVDQQASVYLPLATKVYIYGASSGAISSTGNPFRMHYKGAARCPSTPQSESAQLVIRSGGIANNNGWFQACNTVVLMTNGHSEACLPPLGTVAPPTSRPCPGPSAGNGTLDLGGGGSGSTQIDWTAPNKYDADLYALTPAQKQAAWDAMEDLAFWSEAWSDSSFKMAGGSGLRLVGVFMTPNADPFTVTGGGAQTLTNAQYVATRFEVNGGASLNMVVDPNNTVRLPQLIHFDLVR